MDMRIAFCEECRKDVPYIEKEEYMSTELRGETYSYYGKITTCEECGSELFVNEVNDYNLEQLYKEFRKKNSIISLEKILEIPQKYNIGKRPLSILLGWGEQTFSRYCDGDMPTKQYSMTLQKIYDEPKYYLSILESNKGRLKSQTAYEKSKQSTQMLLELDKSSDVSKIYSVVDYLLYECEDITPLALQKILYYIQGFSYAFLGRFIFEDDCEAWVHGPVYRDIYYKYKEYRFDPISNLNVENELSLPTIEKNIVDSVIKNFGCYSGKILEEFTHSEAPWVSTRGDLAPTVITDRKITKELIGDYFMDVKNKSNMVNTLDIGVYSKKMFEQTFK